ncbi:MAG TPA: hypothetical protein VNH44_06180 [Micropepsaceae bacterium]|nr:hypothetical protein [Micropepsaceae bacterium]
MSPFMRVTRPGYVLALLALALGVAFLITGSAEGVMIVAALEGAFWALLQIFKDRHEKRLTPRP